MTGKDILDKATKILARSDVDRELLLFFVNSVRRAVLRDRDITKFYTKLTMPASGTIDLEAQRVKAVKLVEYNNIALTKLDNYEAARKMYSDMMATGEPRHYYELGTKLMLLPVPTAGSITLLAEVWPADLTDSTLSTDITTAELPEVWVYMAAAEYFDYFDEADKGQYWRQKGTVLLDQYMKELSRQYMEGLDTTIRGYYPNAGRLSDY